MINFSELFSYAVNERHIRLVRVQSALQIVADARLMNAGFRSLIQYFGAIITANGGGYYTVGISTSAAKIGGVMVELEFSAQTTAKIITKLPDDVGLPDKGDKSEEKADSPDDLLERERLGIQGYLAFYHHGGSISIRHWKNTGGLVIVHIPAMPSIKQDVSSVFQQTELINKFLPQM